MFVVGNIHGPTHFVYFSCPLFTNAKIECEKKRGLPCDSIKSTKIKQATPCLMSLADL
jgi:hypothetical protein